MTARFRRAVFIVSVLICASVIGSSLLHEPLASAAAKIPSVFVSNDATHAAPVREQGTAKVRVTNASLRVAPTAPVTGGGGGLNSGEGTTAVPGTATAMSVHMTSNIAGVALRYQGKLVAYFSGPVVGGQAHFVVPLPRPITWDHVECRGAGTMAGQCLVDWVGDEP